MAEWKVIIEIFGVQRQITVPADTEGEALHKVKNAMWSKTKVKIEKVSTGDEAVEFLKSMFNMR